MARAVALAGLAFLAACQVEPRPEHRDMLGPAMMTITCVVAKRPHKSRMTLTVQLQYHAQLAACGYDVEVMPR